MKILTRFRNLQGGQTRLEGLIEETVRDLGASFAGELAEVTVSRGMEKSPPFEARLKIIKPGPDLDVVGRGFTSEQALLKVRVEIRKVIRLRLQRKRVLMPRRSSGALARRASGGRMPRR